MQKPSTCNVCNLYQHYNGQAFVPASGPWWDGKNLELLKNTLPLAFIGEAGGEHEAFFATPFHKHGQSGSLLERCFADLGISRTRVYIHNVIGCRAMNSNVDRKAMYFQQAINHCRMTQWGPGLQQWMDAQRALGRNPHIVALGATAFTALTGYSGQDEESLEVLRGFVLDSQFGPVVPTYHPAWVRRDNMWFYEVFRRDIERALDYARGVTMPIDPYEYVLNPNVGELSSLVVDTERSSPELMISVDIETNEKRASESKRARVSESNFKLVQVQFGYKGRYYSIPWVQEFAPYVAAILESRNPKLGHNIYGFDYDRLKARVGPVNGTLVDSMYAFARRWPGIDKDLQFCASFYRWPLGAWKHLFDTDHLALYGCHDVHAPVFIMKHLHQDMIVINNSNAIGGCAEAVKGKLNPWALFQRHVVGAHNRVYLPMIERGMPVSIDEYRKLGGYLATELERMRLEMQDSYPLELKNRTPRRVNKSVGADGVEVKTVEFGYVKPPKCIKDWQKQGLDPEAITLRAFREEQLVFNAETGRWEKVKPFLPTSFQQVSKYIAWRYEQATTKKERDKWKAPLSAKTQEPSTNEEVLQQLIERTEDELLLDVIEYRKVNKMMTNDLRNWRPDGYEDEDGDVGVDAGMVDEAVDGDESGDEEMGGGQRVVAIDSVHIISLGNTGNGDAARMGAAMEQMSLVDQIGEQGYVQIA